MTVSNTKNSVSYQGTGSQKRFDFTFLMPAKTAVVTLVETLANGSYKATTLAASQYVVTGEGAAAGGYVTLTTAPTAKQRVTIRRELPLTQGTDLVTGAGFYPESVEDMVDESRMIDQQLAEELARAVKVPEGVTADPLDHYNAMMDSVAASAASATSSATSATSASASKTAAANSATAAATSASNASSSASSAAASENNAASSATSANVAKIDWKGVWSAATTYSVRQAVSYLGSSWIAKAASKNVVPGDNASWEPLAMGGAGVAAATTTTSGIARQATDAEALAGTLGGAVFLPPDKSKRSPYYGSAIQALYNTSASGSNFFVPTNGILTLEDDIDLGKYFWVASDGAFYVQPGPTMQILIRGGAYVSSPGVGVSVQVPVTGCWGLLTKTSTTNWIYFVTPNVSNAISARLASNAAMLEKTAQDVAVTPYGLRVMSIIRAGESLNDAKTHGSYIALYNALDIPFPETGYLHVFFGAGTSVYISQLFVGALGRVATRGSSNGGTTWSAWLEMSVSTPGEIRYFAMSAPPTGYLKANGAAVSRTSYAALFAAIGTVYGVGNGSTTFNLPDLRGEFVRGWDDGRGIDVGRTPGSAQGDAIRNITGVVGDTVAGSAAPSGAFLSNYYQTRNTLTGSAFAMHSVNLDASLVVPTAAENRPRNVALLACIKY